MSDYRRDNERYRSYGQSRGDSHRRSREDGHSGQRMQQPRRGEANSHRYDARTRPPASDARRSAPQQGRQRYQQTPSRIANRTPYVDDQMRRRAPNANNYRSRSSQMMSERDMRQPTLAQPTAPQGSLVPRLVIIAVLLVILIVRFLVQGGVFGQFGSVNAQVHEQQTQLEQLTNSNNEMQSQMDSMQSTIDAWNQMHNG